MPRTRTVLYLEMVSFCLCIHHVFTIDKPIFIPVHYYNYDDDPWNPSKVKNTRFASEYGFQSLPSYITLERVSKAEDRCLGTRFMKNRQHHRKGYEEMYNLIRYNLPIDNDDNTENYLKNFIYYSQVCSAAFSLLNDILVAEYSFIW